MVGDIVGRQFNNNLIGNSIIDIFVKSFRQLFDPLSNEQILHHVRPLGAFLEKLVRLTDFMYTLKIFNIMFKMLNYDLHTEW